MENKEFAQLIKDIPTENVYVLNETNAELIKSLVLLPGNRPIKETKVNKLVKAFTNGEYIPPILVTLPSRIIAEGNHRQTAILKCLESGLKFTYRVYMYKDKNALETARKINNTQDRWKANDKLCSFIYENNPNYVKLKDFMDDYNSIFKTANNVYTVQAGLCLLAGNRTRQSMLTTFNSGNLKITDKDIETAKIYMTELMVISEILHTNNVFARDHSTAWIKARTRLGISFPNFITKLKKKAPNWEEPKDSTSAWFTMYLRIAGGI